jgi:hypothetical protein
MKGVKHAFGMQNTGTKELSDAKCAERVAEERETLVSAPERGPPRRRPLPLSSDEVGNIEVAHHLPRGVAHEEKVPVRERASFGACSFNISGNRPHVVMWSPRNP